MKKKVSLEITRKNNVGGIINREVEINLPKGSKDSQFIESAKLNWLNEYINRDIFYMHFNNVSKASSHAKITIKGKVI